MREPPRDTPYQKSIGDLQDDAEEMGDRVQSLERKLNALWTRLAKAERTIEDQSAWIAGLREKLEDVARKQAKRQ